MEVLVLTLWTAGAHQLVAHASPYAAGAGWSSSVHAQTSEIHVNI